MITIIHGDDLSASRNYFLSQRQKDFFSFEGGQITITALVQIVQGSTLFQGPTLKNIAIEGFFTKFKKNDESKEILNFIVENFQTANFIFWEPKEISKKDLSVFKNAAVKVFKLPKNIFLFLDNLKPGNFKNSIHIFHKSLDSGIEVEMVLFMLQRQVRLLLALSDQGEDSIEELSRLAPWQRDKLERQTSYFPEEELKQIYKKLYEIELGQKTGALNLSLVQSIDFLLIEI